MSAAIDWDNLPVMHWEQCEGGCGQMGQTVYALPRVAGEGRTWECRSCYVRHVVQREGKFLGRRRLDDERPPG